ncbi:putative Thioredoxin domain, 5'-adenylylsulfate reductase-like protein [Dioscorea sansibarensis]
MASSFSNLLIFGCVLSISSLASSTAESLCVPSPPAFLDAIELQCPVWVQPSPALEVTGDAIDQQLNRAPENAYYSVLFYASWCPFSLKFKPTFDALSSMFPQIRHFAVEQSSAMPILFSRYGVHSVPAVLLANRTSTVHFHGSKNLSSLAHFYKEITGLDPVTHFAVDEPNDPANSKCSKPWNGSLNDMITKEPYLLPAFLYICLKMLAPVLAPIFSCLKAFWLSHAWRLNMGILGESSQLLERMHHVIDVKKLWSKVRLCNKNRNFQKSAKNARVWASSLASVSLGESSSTKLVPSDS